MKKAEGLQSELALLRRHESEKIFGVQIAGGDVAVMSKVACLKALPTFCFFWMRYSRIVYIPYILTYVYTVHKSRIHFWDSKLARTVQNR